MLKICNCCPAAKRLLELNVAFTNLESQLAGTEEKLHAAEGDREFLMKEVKRLQVEKAELERQFKDLAILPGQASRLEEEIKTAKALSSRPASRQPNYAINTEIRPDGPAQSFGFNLDHDLSNRVRAEFKSTRTGFFGRDVFRQWEIETVLTTDGTNTFFICHIEDTPFTFFSPSADWTSLTGCLTRLSAQISKQRLLHDRSEFCSGCHLEVWARPATAEFQPGFVDVSPANFEIAIASSIKSRVVVILWKVTAWSHRKI